MLLISKKEKEILCKCIPGVHVTRTSKQRSKRHRYYVEEAPEVLRHLKALRELEVAT